MRQKDAMAMNPVSKVVLDPARFGCDFWPKVGEQLRLLMEGGSVCISYITPDGKVNVEHISMDPKAGDPFVFYLYSPEIAAAQKFHADFVIQQQNEALAKQGLTIAPLAPTPNPSGGYSA